MVCRRCSRYAGREQRLFGIDTLEDNKLYRCLASSVRLPGTAACAALYIAGSTAEGEYGLVEVGGASGEGRGNEGRRVSSKSDPRKADATITR